MKVVVIGGGIIGMLTALELVKAGIAVRVLDKSHPGTEASWAGGGIVSPLYPWRYPPAVSALAVMAQELYPALAAELTGYSGIDPELTVCGMLMLGADDARDAMVWSRKYGRRIHLLQGHALAAMGDGLAQFNDGIWLPDVANIRNPRLLQSLRRTLEIRGVAVDGGREVVSWERVGNRMRAVRLAGGETIEADQFVLAAGAWSAGLSSTLAGPMPVRPVKGQMLLFHAPDAGLRHILLHQGHYVIPRRDGHILCGSTLEETGFDKSITAEAAVDLHAVAAKLVPSLGAMPPVAHWAGLRPGSPNGIPFIGRHPEAHNLWVNTGHYRNGLVLAPASVQLLGDLMLGRKPVLDASPYAMLDMRAEDQASSSS
ncbi:MAG: glycine oxidase ThiO [Fluviicoccus sp.]|uniref:glycine oxidase ThiO n=1 Tax=Fluviicoccus sp. TaxID=2003552 RepID=UPI00272116C9|nr:glycine oxidase ThiO [Fluviicoccus sp.]MDO8331470.1 glycine oxidase ThiO [Fluviicoccus sp.]